VKALLWRPLGSRIRTAARTLIVRTLPARSALRPTQALPLDQHLAADRVGESEALQGAAIARRFGCGNLIRHRGDPAAAANAKCEGACALRERAERPALPIEDLDAADMPVSVGISLTVGAAAPPARGTSTMPVVPRMPSVASGVAIFISPVLATRLAMKDA